MYTVHCTVLEDLAKTSVSRNCSMQSWGIGPQNRQRVIDTSGEAGKGNGELGPSARHRTMGRQYGVFALVRRYKKLSLYSSAKRDTVLHKTHALKQNYYMKCHCTRHILGLVSAYSIARP